MKTLLALLTIATLSSADAQISVQWLTQYGSSVVDGGTAITVDTLGQSWVTGYTNGNFGGTNAGGNDIFLSRISATGSVDFTRQRGGASGDEGYGIAIVGSGAIFAGGYTDSGTFDSAAALGGSDSLAMRFDTSGTWQGTTRFGGSGSDLALALAGNATHLLAAGFTGSSFDGETNAGDLDAFLSKRDNTGAVVWTRFLGTSTTDTGQGAAFDSASNGYLTGRTNGSFSGFTNSGVADLFVARYDPTGSRTLLKQFGTSGNDFAYDVEVDLSGNIYLTGYTEGALTGETNAGGKDAFVMKLDSAGNVLWTRLLGGSADEISFSLGLDGTGHVWIGGYSRSSFGGHGNAGSDDGFVAEYDTSGLLLGTTFFATSGLDRIYGLSIGPDGAAYVTGATTGALGSSAGSEDAFVAKIVPEPSSITLTVLGICAVVSRRRRQSV